MRRNPTQAAVGQHHTIFRLEFAFASDRLRNTSLDEFAILRMQFLQETVKIDPFPVIETQQLPPFISCPDFIPHEVSNPDAYIGDTSHNLHPLLALVQLI